MCLDDLKEWSKWLPLIEWSYNSTYHNTIKINPYEIMYGQSTPTYLPYLLRESKIELVVRSLQRREEQLKMVKFHKRAQERMKNLVDKGRSNRTFEIGDLVFMKLHLIDKSMWYL